MPKVYIGVGSNQGNRQELLDTAVRLLGERAGSIHALSSVYESKPWGFNSVALFLNLVLEMKTLLTPYELLDCCLTIEREMGRPPHPPGDWRDRLIDIDILFYNQRVIRKKELAIPHPLLHARDFVLNPLMEIAPDLYHPMKKKTIRELHALL